MPLESPHGRCRLPCLQVISCIQTHSCRPFGALRARLSKHESLSIMGGLLRQVYGVSSVQRPGRMICMKRLEGGASCRSRRFTSVSPFSSALRSSSIFGCSDRLTEEDVAKRYTPPGTDAGQGSECRATLYDGMTTLHAVIKPAEDDSAVAIVVHPFHDFEGHVVNSRWRGWWPVKP